MTNIELERRIHILEAIQKETVDTLQLIVGKVNTFCAAQQEITLRFDRIDRFRSKIDAQHDDVMRSINSKIDAQHDDVMRSINELRQTLLQILGGIVKDTN